jgi:hypothetical protein
MGTSAADHLSRPWRVHGVAPDFELLDVWLFDLGAGPASLDEFLVCFWTGASDVAGSWLARIRLWVGRVLGWDDHELTLPIPGCEEFSVAARLSPEDRAQNRADSRSPLSAATVQPVYRFENEALYEVSNDTIHALLHVGMVDRAAEAWSSLAVYVKSRGSFSRAYMAAIGPFRHLVVYPALVRSVERSWRLRRSEAARAPAGG